MPHVTEKYLIITNSGRNMGLADKIIASAALLAVAAFVIGGISTMILGDVWNGIITTCGAGWPALVATYIFDIAKLKRTAGVGREPDEVSTTAGGVKISTWFTHG